MANIKNICIGASTNPIEDVVSPIHSYLKLNDKGNLELSNDVTGVATDSKVNIVSKTDIQVKPGYFEEESKLKTGTIQFDSDSAAKTEDSKEISFKTCNGNWKKANRVVATKWNTAKWIFDTQKVHSTIDGDTGEDPELFDATDFIMQWRLDKWNDGQYETGKGPISVKMKAKSFDLRCHGNNPGGGIALQPSGADGSGRENKIKFESSRTSAIDAEGTWGAEGGKGLEFGTFNNLHTSLFTGDYRFRGTSSVIAVARKIPTEVSGKTDYPTQADDFKDIIPTVGEGQQSIPTWADVINVVRYIKSGSTDSYADWLAANKLNIAAKASKVESADTTNFSYQPE